MLNAHAYMMTFPLLALLITAAVIDWRTRRIPNWLTFGVMLAGLMRPLFDPSISGATASLGFAVGFTCLFIPFALGVAGGGDVKLIAGLGAWLGPLGILCVVALVYLIESAYVIGLAVAGGKLKRTLDNTLKLFVHLVHVRGISADEISVAANATGTGFVSVGKRLPYAVPTLIGVAVVIGLL